MGGNNQRHPKVRTMNQVTVIEWDSKEQGLQLCGPNKGEESMIQQPELIAASFEDQYTAKLFLDQLKRMEKAGTIELIDAAVLTKQTDGKLKINELGKLRPRQGRRLGAVVGGICGAIFPPSILVSVVVGAVAGGALDRPTDEAMTEDELRQFGDDLKPGQSAILAIVDDLWSEQYSRALESYERLSRMTIGAEAGGVLIPAAVWQTSKSMDIVA
jgi:uncharacterized membrane protein